MKYLLDTHIFLWWLNDDKKLKKEILSLIEDPKNQIYTSVVNAWEISIKHKIGKLPLKTTLTECFKKSPFDLININLHHILQLNKLALKHTDPFDRLLVAQAKAEKLILMTDDPKIKQYNVKVSI